MATIIKEESEVVKQIRKIQARREMEINLRAKGHLSDSDIEEYLDFQFDKEPETLPDQLRYYFLKLKTDNPVKAQSFMADLPIADYTGLTATFVVIICEVLSKYFDEFVLRFNGKVFVKTSKPIPGLKIIYV